MSTDPEQSSNFTVADGAHTKSGGGLALLALVVALAGIALQAWNWMRSDAPDLSGEVAGLEARSQAQKIEQDQLRSELAAVSASITQLANRAPPTIPPDHSQAIETLQQETARLARQAVAVQTQLLDQAAVSQGNEIQLGRSEIEYLLRLANERLQLFADKQSALEALQLAQRQLSAMDDASLLAVRQQLQQDIREAESLGSVDKVLILGELDALENSIDSWPLKPLSTATEDDIQLPEDAGLWTRFKQSLSSLVTIRRQTEPQLTLDEIDWLEERIRTRLQLARLAAMSDDQAVYAGALETVLQWQAEHYDPEEAVNISSRQTLQQLAAVNLQPPLPDITRALRAMQVLRGSATQSLGALPPAEAVEQAADVDANE